MTKKAKKEEALRRLKVLQKKGLIDDVVTQYEENEQVFFSDVFSGALYYIENAPAEILNKIEELEKDGDVVYHVTHEKFEFGECWDLFIITDEDVDPNEIEWRQSDFDEYGIQFSYVVNVNEPMFSEYGSIQINVIGGGIVRIA